MEVNEWRTKTRVPRVEEPARGENFGMVLAGEMEVVVLDVREEEEEGEEGELFWAFGGQQQQRGRKRVWAADTAWGADAAW